MTNKRDKALLADVAKQISGILRDEGDRVGIRPVKTPNIGAEGTDGWSAWVGRLQSRGPMLEVWADRWTGGTARRFYAGFVGSQRAVDGLVARAPDDLQPELTVRGRDTEWGRFGRLKDPLRKEHFRCPIHERLNDGGYFGLYFRDPISNARSRERFVEDASRFFMRVAGASLDDADSDDYPGVERRVVREHRKHERNSAIVLRCKRRDGYTCRVCDFNYRKRYGDLGANFAEAHHILPLSGLGDRVSTRTADLITVCANCHRMLHRMNGEAEDWKMLRSSLGVGRRGE